MINKLIGIGWIFSWLAAVGLSVPFWYFWTISGIGTTYFYFVPEIFQSIPFWDCVGLFIVIAILKGTLTPKFFKQTITQDNSSDTTEDEEDKNDTDNR